MEPEYRHKVIYNTHKVDTQRTKLYQPLDSC